MCGDVINLFGYTGLRLVDCRSTLAEFGCSCQTSDRHLELLSKLREVTKGRSVIIGGRETWRAIVLLSKKTLAPEMFAYTPEMVASLLTVHPVAKEDVFLLEQPSFKLSDQDEEDIKSLLKANSVRRQIISPTLTVVFFE